MNPEECPTGHGGEGFFVSRRFAAADFSLEIALLSGEATVSWHDFSRW